MEDDDQDADQDHPLAFHRGVVQPGHDSFECFLTPDIAREWLIHGVPDCRTLVRRHGLRKWRLMRGISIQNLETLSAQSEPDIITPFLARDHFLSEIAFGIPCKEAIDAIVADGPLIECGAGTGFWSALLAKAGADVRACDSPSGTQYAFSPAVFHNVSLNDAEDFVRANPDRNVLLCWPCYNRDWAYRAARQMKPGRKLFLVSEGHGGCVGDDNLFEELDSNFIELETIYVPVWPTIEDRMDVFIRR